METSLLLAQFIGSLFVVVGLGVLINPDHYAKMTSLFIKNAELYYFSGAISFILGLSIIKFHNLWVSDWRVALTILGWLALIKGVYRIVIPTIGAELSDTLLFKKQALYLTGALLFIFGLWLCNKGFITP